jgi:hypothetical protein
MQLSWQLRDLTAEQLRPVEVQPGQNFSRSHLIKNNGHDGPKIALRICLDAGQRSPKCGSLSIETLCADLVFK